MRRSPSAHSPDARDSRPSFRKPAAEASRRNYRHHSPSRSRSQSLSPGCGKRERSPSRHQEDGIFKKGRVDDIDSGKGREDDRFRRATDFSLGYGSHIRDHRGRGENYDHYVSRRYSSHSDRTYQKSRSDHSRYDDGRYAKRMGDRLTRERNAEENGYRRRDERDRAERTSDARVPDREKVRDQETDGWDKYKSKEREICRGQDKYAKYRDDGSDLDAQQSRLAKGMDDAIDLKDAVVLEARDRDTEKLNGREELKSKADIEKLRDRERSCRGRDEGRELENDKGKGDGIRDRDKCHRGHDEHGKGNKGHSSHEPDIADDLPQEISHNHSRKGDKDKKHSSEKGRSKLSSVEQMQGGHEASRISDHLDETQRLDDNLKGSKWGPEADHPNPTADFSDPEKAKMAAMKAAALVNVNLGGFKSVDEKRKMLWGSKDQKPAVSGANPWETVQFADRDRQEKFNKLMGVKGGVEAGEGNKNTVCEVNTNPTFTTEKQEELQQDLEKQFTAGLRRRDGRTVGLGL